MHSIRLSGLGKCFRFYESKWHRLRGLLFGTGNHAREIWALRNIDLSLERGGSLAVLGANGAGKTTLLQIMAGLLRPTEGTAEVAGSLATLLELGSGFQQDFTGRENVYVSSGLRGFSRKEVDQKMNDIIRFSELEDFIDHPIKHYSSGMLMRLGFATAINVEPDVLLIDEVFAVGDMAFQHKCTRKLRELQKKGVTTVLVTHDLGAAKSLCRQALLLDGGKQVMLGDPEEVTNFYLSLMAKKVAQQAQADGEDLDLPTADESVEFIRELPGSSKMHRHGSGEGKVVGIQILNSNLQPVQNIEFGEEVIFRFFIEYYADVSLSGIGFYIRDLYGNDIVGINTFQEQKPLGVRKKGDRLIVDFALKLHLREGSYSVSPGLSYHPHEPRYLDWIDNAAIFQMQKPATGKQIYGFTYIPNEVSVHIVND